MRGTMSTYAKAVRDNERKVRGGGIESTGGAFGGELENYNGRDDFLGKL